MFWLSEGGSGGPPAAAAKPAAPDCWAPMVSPVLRSNSGCVAPVLPSAPHAADEEEGDVPEVPLEELLEDLAALGLEGEPRPAGDTAPSQLCAPQACRQCALVGCALTVQL